MKKCVRGFVTAMMLLAILFGTTACIAPLMAVGGGALGQAIGRDTMGTVIGAGAAYMIGNELEKIFGMQTGQQYQGANYTATPGKAYIVDGRKCRRAWVNTDIAGAGVGNRTATVACWSDFEQRWEIVE
jgi:hypothetical protein